MNVEPFINKHDVFSTAIITNVKLKVHASGYMVDVVSKLSCQAISVFVEPSMMCKTGIAIMKHNNTFSIDKQLWLFEMNCLPKSPWLLPL